MIKHQLNGITAVYVVDEKNNVSFTFVPTETEDKLDKTKLELKMFPSFTHITTEPMVQIAFAGDSPSCDFSAGNSLRNTESSFGLKFDSQKVFDFNDRKEIVTYLVDTEKNVSAEHHIAFGKLPNVIECWVKVTNNGEDVKRLEFIDSFSVSCLSPFMMENDPDKILMHRIRNNWSGEGRVETNPVSAFNMEDSWSHFGARMEKFGQVGTMPAREFIPFISFEDTINNVTWLAYMEAPASWQIEAGHRNSCLHMSGGLADFNFGHWFKDLGQGESFTTNKAYLVTAQGNLLKACNYLTDFMQSKLTFPASEEDLPVLYNEYLFSWGNPNMEGIKKQMGFLKEAGVKCFVIDAGWFAKENALWSTIGDWDVSKSRFPNGLKGFSDYAKENGMSAGCWFEFECANPSSDIAGNKDMFLTRDGKIIVHGDRLFLDFRKPEVIEYLSQKVIKLLKDSNLKYIKIDYNDNVGLGVDGAESLGEGMRQHINGVIEFFKKIRKEIPDIVMETCSSGGMRHEPVFLTLGSQVSFSDLHEVPEGVVTAMDLHRLIPPRQMQVWSCIKPEYNEHRVYYTLCQGMLGRFCLSGNLADCSEDKKIMIKEAVEFYNSIKFIIKDGVTTEINTSKVTSLRHMHNAVSLTRMSKDGKYAVLYAFRYRGTEKEITFNLPAEYEIVNSFGKGYIRTEGNKVKVYPNRVETFGTVVLVKRKVY